MQNSISYQPQSRRLSPMLFPAFMVVLGVASCFLPAAAGVGLTVVFGVVTLLAGVTYGLLAMLAHGTGTFLWRVLISLVFLSAGLGLLLHPQMGLPALTLLLAATLLVEGLAEAACFLVLRTVPGAFYLALNAALTLLLAALIWRNWPASSVWALGTLIGVDLITSGFTRLITTSLRGPVLST